MLGPNNREACWEDSVGKIFSSCESKPLCENTPQQAQQAGSQHLILCSPPSHAQDEVAALGCGTSVPPHPWPAAGLDPQLSSFRWRYRPESHGLLTLQELCSCTAHSHSSWGREKDTSTNTRNMHVTMMHYSSFPLGFWGFFEKYWYWTGITDETSSDPGAQMRKQLK